MSNEKVHEINRIAVELASVLAAVEECIDKLRDAVRTEDDLSDTHKRTAHAKADVYRVLAETDEILNGGTDG